jgi:hypothetical protein
VHGSITLALVLAALPAAANRGAADTRRPWPATTPFLPAGPSEVLVPVTIGGRGPYRFLLDTGSTHTAITAELVTAVGARAVARTTMRATAGTVDCLVVALPALSVGIAAAEGITATALPAPARAALRGIADGILGQDFLARFSYTLDYRRRQVVWHDADYVAPGLVVPLVPAGGRFLVELPRTARTAAVRRYVPDSAADTLVLFGGALPDDLVVQWQPAAATLESLTGARTVRTAIVGGFHVGSATLDGVVAAVVVGDASRGPDAVDGLLPLHLFASASFNARRRTLVIQPA